MKKITNLLMILMFAMTSSIFAQGVTTSSMNGKIVGSDNNGLPGASIVAIHVPTGSKYGAATDLDGFYRISNMRAGGPYKVTISYVGFEDFVKENINLQLGQKYTLSHKMAEAANALEEVVITATANGIFDSNKNGSGTYVSKRQVATLPTVSRGLGDFLRTTPQAQVNDNVISIAGQNNRYNAIYIDGAVNNDVFGLSGTGTNGGQTGVNPISVDAIESFQVAVAPFDVRVSGFAGGAISAVTRSGTNNFEGSAYGFYRNQSLAGKTPVDDIPNGGSAEKLDDFTAKTYGVRIGGPLITDKLFFFVNYERQEDETPRPFSIDNYIGDSSDGDLQGLSSFLQNTYGYNPGTYENTSDLLESNKLIAKLDWNINDNNKLTLKHSYVAAEQINAATSSERRINFSGRSIFFPSTTNTTTLELSSKFSEKVSNNLVVAYTTVLDDRDPLGAAFPSVVINDGAGRISFGSEPFSTANILEQKIFTLTDNLEIYRGAHTVTIGTHMEYSDVRNVFVRQNFGDYDFSSLEGFLAGDAPFDYDRSYSLQGGIGDDSQGAAEFDLFQFGLYFQDDVQISDNFKLSVGVRFDAPFWSDGLVNTEFNTTTVDLLEAAGKDLQGARVGRGVATSIHIAPRVGFNWNVNGESKTQVRGGFGIFTSRIPLVWPGGVYNNNGLAVAAANQFDLPAGVSFIGDPNGQPVGAAVGSGELGGDINLFASDFKLPQIFKTNLAVDQKLPFWGLIASVDLLYNKNIYAVKYENLNIKDPTQTLNGADNRPLYNRFDRVDNTYFGIYLGSNTNEGYSWNSSLTITKPFANGFAGSVSYSYGDSKNIFEATSSQNSSQWRNQLTVNGKNSRLDLRRSQFAQGHRVTSNASYELKWNDNLKTTFGVFYEGINGGNYSYIYGDSRDLLNDDSRDNALIYVPANQGEINLDFFRDRDGNIIPGAATPDEQWNSLDAYIQGNEYLRSRRGKYAQVNAERSPWSHVVDLKVLQDFSINFGKKKHTLQASFDIFNFTNLINKNWGVRQFAPNFGSISLIETVSGGPDPAFNFDSDVVENLFQIDDSGIQSSRWQMQIGLRYFFN